jgi:Fic family protein
MLARQKNDMTQWLRFFLEGVIQTAESSIQTFKKIIEMKNRLEQIEITKLGKKTKKAQELLLYLYGQPIVDSDDVTNTLQINVTTAIRLINDFISLGILKEMTGFKRNRIFIFNEYIRFFE